MSPEQLAEHIRFFRNCSREELILAASHSFEKDVNLLCQTYYGSSLAGAEQRIRGDVFALLSRQKYAGMLSRGRMLFVCSIRGGIPEVTFDHIDRARFIDRYADALKEITPDTEYLILPAFNYEDVKPFSGRF